jgi:hypothetical protein
MFARIYADLEEGRRRRKQSLQRQRNHIDDRETEFEQNRR